MAGLAVWVVSDRLVIIGPFDRAQIGWAIVVPLFAIAPGMAALAEGRTGERALARFVVTGLSVVSALFVLITLAITTTFLDCRSVTSPLEVVPRALPTAFVAGLAFAGSAAVASRLAPKRGTIVALFVGAAVWIVGAAMGLLVFAASFPAISCAPPQPLS